MSEPSTDAPVVIVTGATGGMGRETVAELSSDYRVIAVGRSAEGLAALAAASECDTWQLDLTDHAKLAKRVATVDRLDAIVHAAAVGDHLSVESARVADWESMLGTNLVAPAELTRLCLPLLRQSAGTIVFVGSGASTRPVPGSAVYSATKHGLKALADVLRIDEAAHGIRVSTVSPGPTDTAMLRSSMAAAGSAYEPDKYIRPESVAGAVRFVLDAPPDVHLTDLAVRPRRELGTS